MTQGGKHNILRPFNVETPYFLLANLKLIYRLIGNVMCGEKRLRSVIHYFLYKVINLYMYAIFRYDLVLKVAITLVSLFLLLQLGRRLFANSGIRERVNPQAVKGYGYCEVNQSKLTNYTVSYQCDCTNFNMWSGDIQYSKLSCPI